MTTVAYKPPLQLSTASKHFLRHEPNVTCLHNQYVHTVYAAEEYGIMKCDKLTWDKLQDWDKLGWDKLRWNWIVFSF